MALLGYSPWHNICLRICSLVTRFGLGLVRFARFFYVALQLFSIVTIHDFGFNVIVSHSGQ